MTGLGVRPGDLKIEHRADGEKLVLVLRGELDLASVPALVHQLHEPFCDGFRHIVIDLAGLDFMDSTGLHCLVDARNTAQANRRRFSLRAGGPQIQRLFELTRTVDHFTFEDQAPR